MKRYLVQCADDAFKILAGDGEWETRLAEARSRLFTTDDALEGAPMEVREILDGVRIAENQPDLSNALRRAISAILEAATKEVLN